MYYFAFPQRIRTPLIISKFWDRGMPTSRRYYSPLPVFFPVIFLSRLRLCARKTSHKGDVCSFSCRAREFLFARAAHKGSAIRPNSQWQALSRLALSARNIPRVTNEPNYYEPSGETFGAPGYGDYAQVLQLETPARYAYNHACNRVISLSRKPSRCVLLRERNRREWTYVS